MAKLKDDANGKEAKNVNAVKVADTDKKVSKTQPVKKSGSDGKKKGFFSRIGKTFKEMISELKKVTWPKWKTVVSSTGVVIVVVLFFLIILTAMDFGLLRLLQLLTENTSA